MAGLATFGQDNSPGIGIPRSTPPSMLFGDPSNFAAAAQSQGSDYDKIMADYSKVASTPITAPNISPVNVSPTTAQYAPTSAVTGSLSNLSDLATTGGFSSADIANIRARAISPIRSIYASAQQNVDQQRALAGGYSPNYNAVQAQMARDESQQISDATTNAEAQIAQDVAQNRISASSPYASAAATQSELQTSAAQRNADIANQINLANANANMQSQQTNVSNALATQQANKNAALSAAGGQASLYGTSPALVNTFGNQVLGAGQLSLNQQDMRNRRLGTVGSLAMS